MNKLNFIILMVSFCSVLLFGNETQQEENTSSTWVQSMRVARKSLIDSNKIQELERMDKDILLKMKEKDISDSEKDACRLINYIIVSRNYYSTNNIALGLELLYSKFSDKNYFLDTVFDIANYDFMKNHLILSTVLNGFKKCIGTNEDKLFKSYKMIAPNFIHYIYDLSEIGSIPVITSLIQFLNSYFILVEDQSDYEDAKQKYIQTAASKMSVRDFQAATAEYISSNVAKFPDTGGGGTGTLLTSGRTGAAAVFTELFTSGGTVSTFRGCSEKNCFISSDDGEIPGR